MERCAMLMKAILLLNIMNTVCGTSLEELVELADSLQRTRMMYKCEWIRSNGDPRIGVYVALMNGMIAFSPDAKYFKAIYFIETEIKYPIETESIIMDIGKERAWFVFVYGKSRQLRHTLVSVLHDNWDDVPAAVVEGFQETVTSLAASDWDDSVWVTNGTENMVWFLEGIDNRTNTTEEWTGIPVSPSCSRVFAGASGVYCLTHLSNLTLPSSILRYRNETFGMKNSKGSSWVVLQSPGSDIHGNNSAHKLISFASGKGGLYAVDYKNRMWTINVTQERNASVTFHNWIEIGIKWEKWKMVSFDAAGRLIALDIHNSLYVQGNYTGTEKTRSKGPKVNDKGNKNNADSNNNSNINNNSNSNNNTNNNSTQYYNENNTNANKKNTNINNSNINQNNTNINKNDSNSNNQTETGVLGEFKVEEQKFKAHSTTLDPSCVKNKKDRSSATVSLFPFTLLLHTFYTSSFCFSNV